MSVNSRKRMIVAAVLFGSAIAHSSTYAAKSGWDAYLESYAKMGRSTAAWAKSQTQFAQAQASAVGTWAKSQATLMGAQATMMKNMAAIRATEAATMGTLQQVRSLAMANSKKALDQYVAKRKLQADYKAQHPVKRVSKEALARINKSSMTKLAPRASVLSTDGVVTWPPVFQGDEFLEQRVKLEHLFTLRKSATAPLEYSVYREAGEATAELRRTLRTKVSQLHPTEYMMARKFIERLDYESRSTTRPGAAK